MENTQIDKEWHKRLQDEITKVSYRYNEFLQATKDSDTNNLAAHRGRARQMTQEKKLSDGLNLIFQKLGHGFENVITHLKDLQAHDPSALDFSILGHIAEMITIASLVGSQQQMIIENVTQGFSLQEAIGIPESGIESLYLAAKYFYEHQLYEEAGISFTLLSLLQPMQPIFWMGLGNCEYFLGKFHQALMAYALASQGAPHDPQYHLFSARCHKMMGNKGGALSSLHLAELVVEDDKMRQELRIKIEPLRQEINRL